jgi:hypothetical protein
MTIPTQPLSEIPEHLHHAHQLGRATALLRYALTDLNFLIARCPDKWFADRAEQTVEEIRDFLTVEKIRLDEVLARLSAPVLDDVAGPAAGA